MPRTVADAPRNYQTLVAMIAVHVGAAAGVVLLVRGSVAGATLAVAAALYVATGLSITAGYHRLFSHRAYRARPVVRWAFLLFGAAALQMSALAWSADHRDHHAGRDGPNDPYSVRHGAWWAHMGWLFRSPQGTPPLERRVPDLVRWRDLRFQHRWYYVLAVGVGLGLPTALGALWGDPLGGLLVAGALRIAVVLHATFCINSLSHLWGRRRYDRSDTARDNPVIALLTFGEGYHSFHHRFPTDYRNGVRAWQYDPTKWLIRALAAVGLTSELRRSAPVRQSAPRARTERTSIEPV